MPQSTRLYGVHASVFTVNTTDYLGELANATLTIEIDTQEGTALIDQWHYAIGIRRGWRLEAEEYVTPGASAANIKAWADASAGNNQVAVVIETKPPSGTDKGIRYSGSGLITTYTHSLPDGAQTVRITITGQGALTVANSS